MAVDNIGRVINPGGVRYLNPADQVLEEMLTGWRRQQLSRNLSIDTINDRERIVRRDCVLFKNAYAFGLPLPQPTRPR